jgi:hypothetical protein
VVASWVAFKVDEPAACSDERVDASFANARAKMMMLPPRDTKPKTG